MKLVSVLGMGQPPVLGLVLGLRLAPVMEMELERALEMEPELATGIELVPVLVLRMG